MFEFVGNRVGKILYGKHVKSVWTTDILESSTTQSVIHSSQHRAVLSRIKFLNLLITRPQQDGDMSNHVRKAHFFRASKSLFEVESIVENNPFDHMNDEWT